MDFESPGVLLLGPVLVVGLWVWTRRRRPALRYSNLALLEGLPSGSAVWVERIGLGLRATILAFGILAFAGPRIPDRTTRLPIEGIAIGMVCDISGSMGEKDFPWQNESLTRLDAARRAFRLFVEGGTALDGSRFDGRKNDSIALVAFAAWPSVECPLTLNHSVVLNLLDRLEPKGAGLDAGTNIGDAIAEGLIRLQSAGPRRRVLVLLTDGEHNATGIGPDAPFLPRQAAQLAANLGIPIYTIDCGGIVPATAPNESREQREAGRATLAAVSEMTRGRSFVATDATELLEVYRTIDQLERAPELSFQYRRYHRFGPLFAQLALGGLILFITFQRLAGRSLPP
jgi:Ca-activated chloride channel family protein